MEASIFNSALSPALGLRPMLTLLLLGLVEKGLHLAIIPDVLSGTWVLVGLAVLAVLETGGEFFPVLATVQGWLALPVGSIVQFVMPYLLGHGAIGATTADGAGVASIDGTDVWSALARSIVPMAMTAAVAVAKGLASTVVDLVPDPITNALRSLGESGAAIATVVLALVFVPLALLLAIASVILAVFIAVRLRRLLRRITAGFSSLRAARREAAAERSHSALTGPRAILAAALSVVTGRTEALRRALFPDRVPPA